MTDSSKSVLEQYWQQLRSSLAHQDGDNPSFYAMADGAAHPHIHAHLEAYQHPCLCLFEHPQVTLEQSPWLFPLKPGDTFSDWYLQESAGRYWGTLMLSPLPLATLGLHLQHYLTAQDEGGVLHLLRLFDPRGCRAVLQVLDAWNRQAFFKPIHALWLDMAGNPEKWQQINDHGDKLLVQTLQRPQAAHDTKGEVCAC